MYVYNYIHNIYIHTYIYVPIKTVIFVRCFGLCLLQKAVKEE